MRRPSRRAASASLAAASGNGVTWVTMGTRAANARNFLARQIGDGAHGALAPQQLIGHRRDSAHADAAKHKRATFAQGFEGEGNEPTHGREDDSRVDGHRCRSIGIERRCAAQRHGESLRLPIARMGSQVRALPRPPGCLGLAREQALASFVRLWHYSSRA